MSKVIIEEHCEARLTFKNTNKGACFSISFPFVDEEKIEDLA
jgi:hypothetical protein